MLGIVARDLKDSQAKDVSDNWRFAIAYNATLQAATAALAAAGYRASRESHHYRVIHSLDLTVGKDAKFVRAFDGPRGPGLVLVFPSGVQAPRLRPDRSSVLLVASALYAIT